MATRTELIKGLENGWKFVRARFINPSVIINQEIAEFKDSELANYCYLFKITATEYNYSVTHIIDIRCLNTVKMSPYDYGYYHGKMASVALFNHIKKKIKDVT